MSDYRSVKIPNEVVEKIIKLIKKHKELGYRSHSEFVNEAVRRRLEDIEKIIK